MQNLVYKTFELNTDIEHKAKPVNLSGATTIKLTELPSNVKCWISTESNGTNLYPLINRGDGWINLPNPLYNLYVYTEGVTIDNQKIILNYTGQPDFFSYGNNSTEKIDKVGTLESLSNIAKFDYHDVNTKLYDTSNIKYLLYVNGAWHLEITDITTLDPYINRTFFTKLIDLKNITFADNAAYKIKIEGHADIGGNIKVDREGEPATDFYVAQARDSLHIDLINLQSVEIDTFENLKELKKLEYINNLWVSTNDFVLERKDNFFTLWGMKYFRTYDTQNGQTHYGLLSSYCYAPSNININIEYSSMGNIFKNMDSLILSLKANRFWYRNNHNFSPNLGFHFSLKIQIEKLELKPGAPIIKTNPYINNKI